MGNKEYQMVQHARQALKNVTRYKVDRVGKPGAIKHQGWAAQPVSIRSGIDELLHYGGVGHISLQGSFLIEVPKLTNLPVIKIVELLDMSKTTFYRVKNEPVLGMDTIDRLSSLFKIYQKGIEAFEGLQPFEDWLHTKIPNLGDQRPMDLLMTENGRNTVMDAIDRVEYGVYG